MTARGMRRESSNEADGDITFYVHTNVIPANARVFECNQVVRTRDSRWVNMIQSSFARGGVCTECVSRGSFFSPIISMPSAATLSRLAENLVLFDPPLSLSCLIEEFLCPFHSANARGSLT